MSLQAEGQVVEDTPELDSTASHLADAGDVLDALRDLVPGRVEFIGRGIARCLDSFVASHQRIELNDFAMAV